MGSKGSATQQQAGTSTYTPNSQILQSGSQALGMAGSAAQSPFQLPVAPVAGFTGDQAQAFQQMRDQQGFAQPYYNQAQGLFNQSAAPISGSQVNNYLNPYASYVMQNLAEQQGQQMNDLTGRATQAAGGVGADRIGVAQGELARQQALASGQTLSGIYGSALSAAQQDAQRQQAAAYGIGNLGGAAQNAAMQGTSALYGMGSQQQQLNQAQLNAPYQNQLARIAFPYQNAQYLAGITGSLAGAMGGTTYSNQNTASTPAPPSIWSQLLGAGTAGAGIAGQMGAFSNPSYGGGSIFSGDAYGGSGSSPLSGLTSADYGAGYADGGSVGGDNITFTGHVVQNDQGNNPLATSLGGAGADTQGGALTSYAPNLTPPNLNAPGTPSGNKLPNINPAGTPSNFLQQSQPAQGGAGNIPFAPSSGMKGSSGDNRGGYGFGIPDVGAGGGFASGGDTSGEPSWMMADPTIPTIALHASQVQQPQVKFTSPQQSSGSSGPGIGDMIKTGAQLAMMFAADGGRVGTPYAGYADGGATTGEALVNGAKAWWNGAKWVAGGGQQGWRGDQNNGPQPPLYAGTKDYPPKYADGGDTSDYVPQDFENRFRDAATMGQIERPRFADSATLGDMTRSMALAHYLRTNPGIKASNEPPPPPPIGSPENPYRQPAVKADGSPLATEETETVGPLEFGGSKAAAAAAAANKKSMEAATYDDLPYKDRDLTNNQSRSLARSPWMALFNAGAGMMAGTSPYAGVNIGKGLLEGSKALETQRTSDREDESVNQRAKQLAMQADQHLRQYTQMTPAGAAAAENQKAVLKQNQAKLEESGWVAGGENMLTGDKTFFNPRTGESGLLKRTGEWQPFKAGAPTPPEAAPAPPQQTAAAGPPMAGPSAAIAPPVPGSTPPPAPPAPYGVPSLAPNLEAPKSEIGYIGKGSPYSVAAATDARTQITSQNKIAQNLPALEQDISAMKMAFQTLTKDADKDGFFSQLGLQPGANLGERLEAVKRANAGAVALGKKPPFDPHKVAAAETIDKLQNKMGLTFASQISPREAMQGQMIGVKSAPGLTNSAEGFKRLLSGFESLVQDTKAQQAFFQNYLAKNGHSLGWRQEYDRLNPSEKFVVGGLIGTLPDPLQKALPEAVAQLRSDPKKYKDIFNKHYADTADFFLKSQ